MPTDVSNEVRYIISAKRPYAIGLELGWKEVISKN